MKQCGAGSPGRATQESCPRGEPITAAVHSRLGSTAAVGRDRVINGRDEAERIMKTIAIIGRDGTNARPWISPFLASGWQVRNFVRDPGKVASHRSLTLLPSVLIAIFPQIVLAAKPRNGQTVISASWFSTARSMPAFPTPLWLVIGRRWPWQPTPGPIALGRSRSPKREQWPSGSDAMGIDLKKVNVEITDLKSMLAAIDHHIEECRLRYFEDPWAARIRRRLTFERHRVQRRLEELTFVCRCVGERAPEAATVLSFRSFAGSGERNTEDFDRAISELKRDRPKLRIIQGGHS
jgi:hypothetical protein